MRDPLDSPRRVVPQSTHEKLTIALSQLETALHLFQDGKDLFSVITLAGAAEEILGQLLKESGRGNALDALKRAASAIHEQLFHEEAGASQFATRANRARNAIKHHNPGQSQAVTFDPLEEATDMLDRAITNYWLLEQKVTPAMGRFADYQRAV